VQTTRKTLVWAYAGRSDPTVEHILRGGGWCVHPLDLDGDVSALSLFAQDAIGIADTSVGFPFALHALQLRVAVPTSAPAWQ
jgi:hypothetical protein